MDRFTEHLRSKLLESSKSDRALRDDLRAMAAALNIPTSPDEAMIDGLVAFAPRSLEERLKVAQEASANKALGGFAIAGFADPTPSLDGLGAVTSLGMAAKYEDWVYVLDAPLFIIGAVLPYLGDALGKGTLAARIANRIRKLGPAGARLREVVLHRTRFLAAVAYATDIQRSGVAKQFFARFKNEPKFAAWVEAQLPFLGLKLEPGELTQAMSRLLTDFRGQGVARRPATINIGAGRKLERESIVIGDDAAVRRARQTRRGPTKYEVRVLALRKGDTVVAKSAKTGKSRSIVLGKYLGSGNVTHVFEIANSSGEVVRLPFVTADLLSFNWKGRKVVGSGREYAQQTVADADRYRGMTATRAVGIRDWGEGFEYVVAELVDIVDMGDDFVRKFRVDKTPANMGKYRKLEAAVREVREQVVNPRPLTDQRFEDYARQFGWDGSDWVLLDWDRAWE